MSYRLLFLCEYFMVTRDEEILPAIEKIALCWPAVRACMAPLGTALPH